MRNKDIKKLFSKECERINIEMSDEVKSTPISVSQGITRESEAVAERKRWRLLLPVTATVCAFALLFAFVLPNISLVKSSALTAYIIEINPSFALVADGEDKIVNLCSLNDDADEILNSEAFDDLSDMTLDEAIEKVIEITSSSGILDGYSDTIRIYALNDDALKTDKKLDEFGEFLKKDLKKFGHGDIEFVKRPMELDFFKEKMGFEKDFERLDDMREDIKARDRFNGENPPPPRDNGAPPPPDDKEALPPKEN